MCDLTHGFDPEDAFESKVCLELEGASKVIGGDFSKLF